MTSPSMQHIALASAYLCPNCNSIGNWSVRCPACASSALLSLATILDRKTTSSTGVVREFNQATNTHRLEPLRRIA